jgi:cation diffusion facilitator CzcD-associated flavoprotein CzcO
LKSNNLLGTYEFSEFPLDSSYGVKEGNPLPADVVHQYLMDYSKKFGVYERIRFSSKVESCEHQCGGGWVITVSGRPEMFASKLIVATGLTSDPFLPNFKGSDSFEPPLFHSREFKKNADTIHSASQVCVLGGTKV